MVSTYFITDPMMYRVRHMRILFLTHMIVQGWGRGVFQVGR